MLLVSTPKSPSAPKKKATKKNVAMEQGNTFIDSDEEAALLGIKTGLDPSNSESEDGEAGEKLSASVDSLSKSANSLALAENDKEILPDAPASSTPKKAKSPAKKQKSGLPLADLLIYEEANWSAEKETEEALKERKARRRVARKNKRKEKAAKKKDELEKARTSGKEPPRACLRCKTKHWEQDPCPSSKPPPAAAKVPEKPALTPVSNKRKRVEEPNSSSLGPSKKGTGRVSSLTLAKDVSIRAVAGRREPNTTPEFQDGTHCFLNLPKFSKIWRKGRQPEHAFSLKEVVTALTAAGLRPKQATDASATVEWLIKFESVSAAQEAVGVPFTLRGVEVRLSPFFGQGPRLFICKTKGAVTWEELIKNLHLFAPKSKFKLKREEFAGCKGNKCLLIFDKPQTATQISLTFKTVNFTVAFVPLPPVPPCAICCKGHKAVECGSVVPVPSPPGTSGYYDNSISDH